LAYVPAPSLALTLAQTPARTAALTAALTAAHPSLSRGSNLHALTPALTSDYVSLWQL